MHYKNTLKELKILILNLFSPPGCVSNNYTGVNVNVPIPCSLCVGIFPIPQHPLLEKAETVNNIAYFILHTNDIVIREELLQIRMKDICYTNGKLLKTYKWSHQWVFTMLKNCNEQPWLRFRQIDLAQLKKHYKPLCIPFYPKVAKLPEEAHHLHTATINWIC